LEFKQFIVVAMLFAKMRKEASDEDEGERRVRAQLAEQKLFEMLKEETHCEPPNRRNSWVPTGENLFFQFLKLLDFFISLSANSCLQAHFLVINFSV
jgi:hypothetical protein